MVVMTMLLPVHPRANVFKVPPPLRMSRRLRFVEPAVSEPGNYGYRSCMTLLPIAESKYATDIRIRLIKHSAANDMDEQTGSIHLILPDARVVLFERIPRSPG